jgi:hypothetical protein
VKRVSKSVLVIDTPENCLDCQFCYELDEGVEACCSISDDDEDASLMKKIDCEHGYCQCKPDWCPLKPLPEKMTGVAQTDHWNSIKAGWNQCIDAITGGNADD